MSGRRKMPLVDQRLKTGSVKPLPTILSRKRKNEEDPMQPVTSSFNDPINNENRRISTATSMP